MSANTETIAEELHSVAIRLLRAVREADRKSGIGPAQLSALSVLAFRSDISVSELAEIEQVAMPTMSRIVAALEEAGYVDRHADLADRRRSICRLTESGREVFNRARNLRLSIVKDMIAPLEEEEKLVIAKATVTLRNLLSPDA